jgi:hypothetical protein
VWVIDNVDGALSRHVRVTRQSFDEVRTIVQDKPR